MFSKRLQQFFLLRAFALSAALMLAACAEMPRTQAPPVVVQKSPIELAEEALARARGESNAGGRASLLLEAANRYRQLDLGVEARAIYSRIDANLLTSTDVLDYALNYSDSLVAVGEYFMARSLLTAQGLAGAEPFLSTQQRAAWRRARAELFALLGEDQRAIAEYALLSGLLAEPEAITEVHGRVWNLLVNLPDARLREAESESLGRDLRGWYQLALLGRRYQGDIRQWSEQLSRWRGDWPGHPAVLFPPDNMRMAQNMLREAPTRLALLLPLSGRYARAGQTIREGFLAAYYDVLEKQGQTPPLDIYDTEGRDIVQLYQQAVAGGAEHVIGPLRKEKLAELAARAELTTPVIGLNYIEKQAIADFFAEPAVTDDGLSVEPVSAAAAGDISVVETPVAGVDLAGMPADTESTNTIDRQETVAVSAEYPANLVQFGLSVDDELRQIAERAWVEGHRSVLLISPDTRWAATARDAFQQRWTERGGQVHFAAPYGLETRDFSSIIKPALQVDQSVERAKKIRRTLGKEVLAIPRRRWDIDLVVVMAYPDHGRAINPMLDFFFAHDLPVYATSHISTGEIDPRRNRDLNGIRFSAMPWTLPGIVADHLKPGEDMRSTYRNLFALGVDAYQLHQWVALMRAQPDTPFFGHTGRLSLDGERRIRHTYPWGEFVNGEARAVTMDALEVAE